MSFVADRTWDLRVEDKIFLYIDNINSEIPFAVLYNNNQGNYQFSFDKPCELNNLELIFKDSKKRPYYFHNLRYSINIQLEIFNDDKIEH
jgi:hypothetical protein